MVSNHGMATSPLGVPGEPAILEAYPLSATSAYMVWIAGGDVADTTHFQIQYRLR